jgi:uncharacterized protein YecE (DUF72 family)
VEFRHESWWNRHAIRALRLAGISFCNVSFPGLPVKPVNTNGHFYLRMHGVPELFKSAYSLKKLREVKTTLPARSQSVNIYFNNTWFDAGFTNALQMQKLMT